MDDKAKCPLYFFGEEVDISEREARELMILRDHPGYDVLLTIFSKMQTGTRDALESVDTPLDTVRGLQGRLSVVTDVNALLNEGIPAWVAAMSKETEHAR